MTNRNNVVRFNEGNHVAAFNEDKRGALQKTVDTVFGGRLAKVQEEARFQVASEITEQGKRLAVETVRSDADIAHARLQTEKERKLVDENKSALEASRDGQVVAANTTMEGMFSIERNRSENLGVIASSEHLSDEQKERLARRYNARFDKLLHNEEARGDRVEDSVSRRFDANYNRYSKEQGSEDH